MDNGVSMYVHVVRSELWHSVNVSNLAYYVQLLYIVALVLTPNRRCRIYSGF